MAQKPPKQTKTVRRKSLASTPDETPEASEALEGEKVNYKRIPPNTIRIQMAGDLIIAKCPNQSLSGLYRKFQTLFEKFANTERLERVLNYKFLLALVLTSHAKKELNVAKKKQYFDVKNQLFLSIANTPQTRKKVAFLYLKSDRPRILEYCNACKAKNTKEEIPKFNWKFCDKCKVDQKFFNIISMQHRFTDGAATIFLSQDMIESLKNLQITKSAPRKNFEEEITFQKYKYGVKDLDSIAIEDTLTATKKLLTI